MNSALAVIHWCIRDCARSRDGRGAWRVERRCADLLGGSAIDINTAAAARRFGEWLRNRSSRPATSLLAGPLPSAGASRPGATS